MSHRLALLRPILLAAVVMMGLACGPCALLSRSSPTPTHRVVVSTEAAGQLESRIQQILSSPPGQQFILRMTDAEATSLLTTQLAKYSESPLQAPVVWFTKGKVYATGRLVNVVPIPTAFSLVASARIQGGKVAVEIEELSAGSLPLPAGARDIISTSLNQTVDEMQLGVEITALEVLEGEAIVRGSRK